MTTFVRSTLTAFAVFTVTTPLLYAQLPPKSWVDKDTGHRVWRLSDEPNSGGFYFNINAYTPDHKSMIYTAPDGIHVLDMETLKTRLLVPNPPAGTDAAADPSAVRGAGEGRNPHALVAQRRQAERREAVLRANIKELEQTDTQIRWSEMSERRLRRNGWTLQPPPNDQVARKP